MSAEIRVLPSAGAVGVAVARRVATVARECALAGRPCVLGWPSGRTPRPVLAELSVLAAAGEFDASHVVFAMMDEYLVADGAGWQTVPADAHFSCRGYGEREIADRLNAVLPAGRRLPAEGVWVADPADPGAYDERIAAAGGIALFVVAIGSSDGHVAFNPPGTPRDSRTRVVPLADSTRRDNLGTFPHFRDISEVPTHGVSVGLATIAEARELAVVAHGVEKRAAVRTTLAGTGFDPYWPASVVRDHPRHVIYLDQAAAPESAVELSCADS